MRRIGFNPKTADVVEALEYDGRVISHRAASEIKRLRELTAKLLQEKHFLKERLDELSDIGEYVQ